GATGTFFVPCLDDTALDTLGDGLGFDSLATKKAAPEDVNRVQWIDATQHLRKLLSHIGQHHNREASVEVAVMVVNRNHVADQTQVKARIIGGCGHWSPPASKARARAIASL